MRFAVQRTKPHPIEPNSAHSPIDHAHLARYTLGDRALELEILSLFVAQAPLTLAMIEAADSDKAWRDATHTLKGSARAVGAPAVAVAAAAAEQLSTARREERTAAICALREAVEEAARYVATLTPLPQEIVAA